METEFIDYGKWINAAGLILDMAGASLMFFHTPKHSRRPEGNSGMDQMRKGADYLFWGKALDHKEWLMIRLGFWLILGGFGAQLISGFL